MATTTLEPLRWQDQSSRVFVDLDGEPPLSHFQVTVPCDVASLCRGRPVEELPRILSILSPAHHLASAMALDNLFGLTPPPLAENMRNSLNLSLTFKHHLRKLFYLLSSFADPLAPVQGPRNRSQRGLIPHHVLDEMMQGVALAQEAGGILGGRSDHPLSVVAGGVSRYLKTGHYARLSEIAADCVECAQRLSDHLHQVLLGRGTLLEELIRFPVVPMASLVLTEEQSMVVITDSSGKESGRFPSDKTLDVLGLRVEPWTFRPFAHFKDKGWKDLTQENGDELFFVGPLARINRGITLDTPLAEQERQRMREALEACSSYSAVAAYWALLVELFHAAEKMQQLYREECLTGPAIRVLPSTMGQECFAALEAPEGFIFHQYRVDGRGIVDEVQILDAATENNALQVLLTRQVVAQALAHKRPWDEAKSIVEMSLMPF